MLLAYGREDTRAACHNAYFQEHANDIGLFCTGYTSRVLSSCSFRIVSWLSCPHLASSSGGPESDKFIIDRNAFRRVPGKPCQPCHVTFMHLVHFFLLR